MFSESQNISLIIQNISLIIQNISLIIQNLFIVIIFYTLSDMFMSYTVSYNKFALRFHYRNTKEIN